MRNSFLLFSWNESLINQTNSALATAHFDPGLERYNVVCSTSLKLGDKSFVMYDPSGVSSSMGLSYLLRVSNVIQRQKQS